MMERNLLLENEQSRSDMKTLEEQLKSLKSSSKNVCLEPIDMVALGDDETLPEIDNTILRHKCELLKAQLDSLREDTVLGLPEDTNLHKVLMKDDLLEACKQYRECTAFLNSQKKEITEEIERRRQDNEKLEAVVKAAEMKLNETVNEKFSKEEVFGQLKGKCSSIDKLNKKQWEEMSSFLDKNYPLPSPEIFNKVKKKMFIAENSTGTYNQMKLQELKPLKDIVQELMILCIDNPNDPYIVLDHRYWPPYVDLLIQCDVALRHREYSNRIKLMPFHL